MFSVVRQALLQNQTPEIQAKLLAMQKHMVQQKSGEFKSIMPPATVIQTVGHQETVRALDSLDQRTGKPRPPLSLEQKEEHARYKTSQIQQNSTLPFLLATVMLTLCIKNVHRSVCHLNNSLNIKTNLPAIQLINI